MLTSGKTTKNCPPCFGRSKIYQSKLQRNDLATLQCLFTIKKFSRHISVGHVTWVFNIDGGTGWRLPLFLRIEYLGSNIISMGQSPVFSVFTYSLKTTTKICKMKILYSVTQLYNSNKVGASLERNILVPQLVSKTTS